METSKVKVKPGDVIEITSPWLSSGLYDVGDRFVVTEVQEGSGVFSECSGLTGPIRVFLADWEYRRV